MSSKGYADRKSIALKINKDLAETGVKQAIQSVNNKQHPVTASSGEVLVFDNCSTTVEVTVKTKGRKRTSTMVSGSSANHKAIEEKKKAGSNCENPHNWGRILGEQNRVAMKQNLQQSLQQYAAKTHTSKSTRQSTDSKEARKVEVHRSQRYELGQVAGKHLDEVPVKQDNKVTRKSMEQLKTILPTSVMPSTTSFESSMESIIVVDKGVQCAGIFGSSNNRLGAFNPVRTLGFLMKELEGLIKGDRSGKILFEMEQALLRIPTEPGKPTPADVDAIALRAKLVANTAKLEATSQKLNATCESLREQRDSLQQQLQNQAILLDEARQREAESDAEIKKLRNKVDDLTSAASFAQETINSLKDDNERIEALEKLTADLRSELNDQTELAQQRFMEGQYLKLEKEKLVVLSAFKDSQLVEQRAALKDLQNLITEQLADFRKNHNYLDNEISMLHGGKACSSPTPTSSDHSNVRRSWHELSDISLSTVGGRSYNYDEKNTSRDKNNSSFHAEMAGDSERKRAMKDVKTQLEFISLPGGETSQTISLPLYRAEETKRHSNAGIGDEIDASRDARNNLCDIVSAISGMQNPLSTDEMSANNVDKSDENGVKSLYKSKMSPTEKTKKHRSAKDHTRNKSVVNNSAKQNKEYSSGNQLDLSIKQQFRNIFKDMRQQSRMPVNIPGPPRHYPDTDWSDSSLPSISGISESNIA